MIFLRRGFVDKKSWYNLRNFEESPEASLGGWDDWWGLGALLQADSTSVQHVQKQEMYAIFKKVNIGDKIDYGQRKNENMSDLIQ